jgi:hypothetical protein
MSMPVERADQPRDARSRQRWGAPSSRTEEVHNASTGASEETRRASRARRRRAHTRSARADGARSSARAAAPSGRPPQQLQHARRTARAARSRSISASTSGSACGRDQPSASAAPARRATRDPRQPERRCGKAAHAHAGRREEGRGSSPCAPACERRAPDPSPWLAGRRPTSPRPRPSEVHGRTAVGRLPQAFRRRRTPGCSGRARASRSVKAIPAVWSTAR